MEFQVTDILGLSLDNKNSVCVITWNYGNNDCVGADHDLAYVACAGAGAILVPMLPQNISEQKRHFYYQPPRVQQYSNVTASSPNTSPEPSNNSRSTKVIRVNKSICVDATSKAKQIAIGEDGGYMSRLLLYDLFSGNYLDSVTDMHPFGVKILRFSPSGLLLASIGTPQDGYIYVWDTSQNKLTQMHSNKCISEIKDLVWINETQILTVGVRHLKVWNIDPRSFGGRNMVLGPLIDQTFECAQPVYQNGDMEILVGTNKGFVYRMPGGKVLISNLKKPVTSISVTDSRVLSVSTQAGIFQYDINSLFPSDLENIKPFRDFKFGARALYSFGNETYYLTAYKREANKIDKLLDNVALSLDNMKIEDPDDLSRFISQSGILFSASDSSDSILSWTGDSKYVLRWPSQMINVPLNDITTAYAVNGEYSDCELIVGSLSGDIFLKNRLYSAHNGPVTDSHICGNYAVSSSRDRTIQVWVQKSDSKWYLKQTLLFTSPVLRVRLCFNEFGHVAITCCCVNKTVYIYSNNSVIDIEDDTAPAFSTGPRSLLVKGMPFDMCAHKRLSILSTNDKMVYVIDPWSEDKIKYSWRPHDSNVDLVNLTHIQFVKIQNHDLLLGSSSNKAVLLYELINGDLFACQWGYGETLSGVAWTGTQLIAASDNIYISTIVPVTNGSTATTTDSIATATTGDTILSPLNTGEHNMSPHSPIVTGSLPNFHHSNINSSPTRSLVPERKVFTNTKSPTLRSRSISPTRVSSTHPFSPRSASPPPRTAKPSSPLKERGRPTLSSAHAINNSSTSSTGQKPNLSFTAVNSSQNKNAVTGKLINALHEYIASTSQCDFNEELTDLLIAALNKHDGLSLVKYFGDQLCHIVEKKLGKD